LEVDQPVGSGCPAMRQCPCYPVAGRIRSLRKGTTDRVKTGTGTLLPRVGDYALSASAPTRQRLQSNECGRSLTVGELTLTGIKRSVATVTGGHSNVSCVRYSGCWSRARRSTPPGRPLLYRSNWRYRPGADRQSCERDSWKRTVKEAVELRTGGSCDVQRNSVFSRSSQKNSVPHTKVNEPSACCDDSSQTVGRRGVTQRVPGVLPQPRTWSRDPRARSLRKSCTAEQQRRVSSRSISRTTRRCLGIANE
jgi:hypothetical protein